MIIYLLCLQLLYLLDNILWEVLRWTIKHIRHETIPLLKILCWTITILLFYDCYTWQDNSSLVCNSSYICECCVSLGNSSCEYCVSLGNSSFCFAIAACNRQLILHVWMLRVTGKFIFLFAIAARSKQFVLHVRVLRVTGKLVFLCECYVLLAILLTYVSAACRWATHLFVRMLCVAGQFVFLFAIAACSRKFISHVQVLHVTRQLLFVSS